MKPDIRNRKDINRLVRTFYELVREDDKIGPVFNQVIKNWEEHFEVLTDFWETNLFFVPVYKGNPHLVHIDLDRKTGNIISQKHFGRWLQLWFRTVDELFEGEKAETAKQRARKMSTMMYIKIWQAREPKK